YNTSAAEELFSKPGGYSPAATNIAFPRVFIDIHGMSRIRSALLNDESIGTSASWSMDSTVSPCFKEI
ncbi:hypothetical protein E4U57_001563, partial [Claviceps arundinis]